MASSVKNELKIKAVRAKNSNAKYVIKYTKNSYSYRNNDDKSTSLTYSRKIYKISKLNYRML